MADGFFKGSQAQLRELSYKQLWPPLAAYMSLMLSAPCAADRAHCHAFRFLPLWPKAMVGVNGPALALAALYTNHAREKKHNLEYALEAMACPAKGP
eukprot:6290329-Prymnesium_polylepis.2